MKLNIIAISIVIYCTLVASCKLQTEQLEVTTSRADIIVPTTTNVTHTPQFDWTGTYEGLLPCADCVGIKTTITLENNQSYILKQTYLGKANSSETTTGYFYFNTKDTSLIMLDHHSDERQFFVAKDFIEARNSDGSEITSILKPHYKLSKVNTKEKS